MPTTTAGKPSLAVPHATFCDDHRPSDFDAGGTLCTKVVADAGGAYYVEATQAAFPDEAGVLRLQRPRVYAEVIGEGWLTFDQAVDLAASIVKAAALLTEATV